MSTAAFFAKVRTYTDFSEKAEQAWATLLHRKIYLKDDGSCGDLTQPVEASIGNGENARSLRPSSNYLLKAICAI